MARSAGFKFSDAGLADVERNMASRVREAAVIEKRQKRIVRYLDEMRTIAASPDDGSEQANVVEQRLNKANIAKQNAELQIAKLAAQMPIEPVLRCAELADEEITDLQTVLARFEQRLSYSLARDKFFKFLGVSEKMLGPIKRIIHLAVAIKTGGAALL